MPPPSGIMPQRKGIKVLGWFAQEHDWFVLGGDEGECRALLSRIPSPFEGSPDTSGDEGGADLGESVDRLLDQDCRVWIGLAELEEP